jgi:hypothetical protein
MEPWELEERPVTVGQLIAKLQQMPQDAKVWAIYDGFCSVDPEHVWLSRGGYVVMVDANSPVYHEDARPEWAPHERDESNWHTPEVPR